KSGVPGNPDPRARVACGLFGGISAFGAGPRSPQTHPGLHPITGQITASQPVKAAGSVKAARLLVEFDRASRDAANHDSSSRDEVCRVCRAAADAAPFAGGGSVGSSDRI